MSQLWQSKFCDTEVKQIPKASSYPLFFTVGSDLSTSDNEDVVVIESESFGTWFYGTTRIFLWETRADSPGSAIWGFWDSEITLNFAVI